MTPKERYLSYLQTEHWEWLRREVFDRFGHHCLVCGSNDKVDAHHLLYRDLTDCIPDDLMPLCRRCHDLCHAAKALNEEHYADILRLSPAVRRQSVVAFIKAHIYKLSPTVIPKILHVNSVTLNTVRLCNHKHKRRFMDYAEYQRKHAT